MNRTAAAAALTAATAAAAAGVTASGAPATPVAAVTAVTPAARSRPGATTTRSRAFVAALLPRATELGARLGDEVDQPAAFVTALRVGFTGLADPDYRAGQELVAPGIGPLLGVRSPLAQATWRSLRRQLRGVRPATLLLLADALLREPLLELRWFALPILTRILPDDPERAWQLLRRVAREASDWITVDALAHPVGAGILLEAYRWAELEQLVYSPSRWERRLVGSTIATLPFVDRLAGRSPEIARRALPLLDELLGDAEPDVQKALSWALRSLTLVDPDAVSAFCEHQAGLAAATSDGHRAWVVRDALPKLDPDRAARLRGRLDGLRRRPGTPSTSRAAMTAARFGELPDPRLQPEPPLI